MKTLFVLVLASYTFLPFAFATPSRVILIRHAEKPADDKDPHLAPIGRERAKGLVNFFKNDDVIKEKSTPSEIIAMPTHKDSTGSVRAIETVEPFATDRGIQIDLSFKKKEFSSLAQKLLSQEKYNGKVVLICWNREGVPEIAKGLGVDEKLTLWETSVFDRAWILDFSDGKLSLFRDIPQRILGGDSLPATQAP